MIENIVTEEFLAPLLGMIEDLKEKIPIEPQSSIKAIKVILKLIEETQIFMIEKLRRYDMMSSIKVNSPPAEKEENVEVIKLHEMKKDGKEEEVKQKPSTSVLYGFHDEIMLKVNNAVQIIF